jgi:hypothetical protein
MGMILELSPPGVQDPGKAGEVGADAALLFGEPFAGRCRGLEEGLGGEALMGADEGS